MIDITVGAIALFDRRVAGRLGDDKIGCRAMASISSIAVPMNVMSGIIKIDARQHTAGTQKMAVAPGRVRHGWQPAARQFDQRNGDICTVTQSASG